MKKIISWFLTLVMVFTMSSPAFATNTKTPETQQMLPNDFVLSVLFQFIREDKLDLPAQAYEMLRTFIRNTTPTDTYSYASMWKLSDNYLLVLDEQRNIFLRTADMTYADKNAATQTIDFAGCTDLNFPFFGFAGSTWFCDSKLGILRRWTLGEEVSQIKVSLVGTFSYYSNPSDPTNANSDHVYLRDSKGNIARLDANGKVTLVKDASSVTPPTNNVITTPQTELFRFISEKYEYASSTSTFTKTTTITNSDGTSTTTTSSETWADNSEKVTTEYKKLLADYDLLKLFFND